MALIDYTLAIQIDPESALAYSKRAVARDRIGDKKAAAEDRQKAASLPEARMFFGAGEPEPKQCQDTSNS